MIEAVVSDERFHHQRFRRPEGEVLAVIAAIVLLLLPIVWSMTRHLQDRAAEAFIEDREGVLRRSDTTPIWLRSWVGTKWRGVFQRVTFVDATDSPLGPDGAAALGRFRSAVGFEVPGTGLTDAGLAQIAERDGLEVLDMSRNAITGAGIRALTGATNLRVLKLNRTGLVDADMGVMLSLKSLQTLQLDGTQMTDSGVRALSSLPDLRRLTLRGTSVTGTAFAVPDGFASMQRLVLDDTPVTDASLDAVASFRKLIVLSINNTAVTDASVPTLAAMPSLRWIGLHGTQVSEEGCEQLQRARLVWGQGVAEVVETFVRCRLRRRHS